MSKPSKKKFEKQKKRELESKKVVMKRRAALRIQSKKDKEKDRLERESQIKLSPIVNARHARTPDEIKSKIEENLAALKALEQEYIKDNEHREELNKSLEAEGYSTIKEKLDFLNEQARQEAEEAIKKKNRRKRSKKA